LELYKFKEAIEDITDAAKNELKMDKNINVIINFWKDV